jgi:hypothetical protein
MMEAARTSETSVDNHLHGSTTQKTALNIKRVPVYVRLSLFLFCFWTEEWQCRQYGADVENASQFFM